MYDAIDTTELQRAWGERSSPDDWGVPAVYERGFRRLLAAEFARAAMEGATATDLARRAHVLLNTEPWD